MQTMRWLIVIAAVAGGAATARADIKLRGWTADGKAVIESDAETDRFSACTPQPFGADEHGVAVDCDACGTDAAACGVVAGTVKSSMTSPDKRLVLTRSEGCWWTGHDGDIRQCSNTVTVGRLGAVSHTDEVSYRDKRAKLSTVFRPDGGALAVVFSGGTAFGDDVFVIDLGELTARDRAQAAAAALLARQAKALSGQQADDVYEDDATFFTDDAATGALDAKGLARLVGTTASFGPAEIEASFDGHAAWVSFVATAGDRKLRVTELLVRELDDWRIASGYWTLGLADADAHALAAAGTIPAAAEVARARQDLPDEISVLGAMLRDGDPELLARFSSRPRTMTVGTAPGERLLGAAPLKGGWKAWFTAGVTGARVRGDVSPRGSTGWIVANLKVAKVKDGTRFQIPVRVWLVVDRDAGMSLEVVLSHKAVTR